MSRRAKMTPNDAKSLLNYPDNCSVNIKDVGNSCFRVNVYEKFYVDDSVVPRMRLRESAYCKYTEDGYKNITIKGKLA
jgi:hypothetical protein